jgi:hypothetical protein
VLSIVSILPSIRRAEDTQQHCLSVLYPHLISMRIRGNIDDVITYLTHLTHDPPTGTTATNIARPHGDRSCLEGCRRT